LYDLENVNVLTTQAYAAIAGPNLSVWSKRVISKCRRFSRYEAQQLWPGSAPAPENADALSLLTFDVAPEAVPEFDRWYGTEYAEQLAEIPGVVSARGYRSRARDHGYLVLTHFKLVGVSR